MNVMSNLRFTAAISRTAQPYTMRATVATFPKVFESAYGEMSEHDDRVFNC